MNFNIKKKVAETHIEVHINNIEIFFWEEEKKIILFLSLFLILKL